MLLELFTSEGCSSCPPADALLARLNGMKTDAGDLIVGISEHVTYWNQLGWRDPFSTDTATERQNAYGAVLHVDEVYTPQMVINGEVQVLGSDARAVVHALENAHSSPTKLRIESAKTEGRKLNVSFSLTGTLPKGKVDIYAVIAEDAASSSVARGENAGHTLSHVAVATTLVKVATIGLTPERKIRLPLPAAPAGTNSKRHLILFAQMPGLGPVLARFCGALTHATTLRAGARMGSFRCAWARAAGFARCKPPGQKTSIFPVGVIQRHNLHGRFPSRKRHCTKIPGNPATGKML